MTYVQAVYGGGGWPLSVFLTPDLKPMMGGTYFPPDDKYGRPGFKTVLRLVLVLYRKLYHCIIIKMYPNPCNEARVTHFVVLCSDELKRLGILKNTYLLIVVIMLSDNLQKHYPLRRFQGN